MLRDVIGRVGQQACVCVALVCALCSGARAEDASAANGSGIGLGGAYLFGLIAGLAIFGLRHALMQRKAHLANHGK
jgi:hypothetical protein